MTDSPAAAGRTTRNLRRVGAVAAALSGVLLSAIVATEVSAATHGSPGAHFSLYAGAMLCAVLAASCLSLAFARRLMDRSDEKVDRLAEKVERNGERLDLVGEKLDRISDRLTDLVAVQQRKDYETGLMAAELADLVETVRQLVAESARWRTALRDAEVDRAADAEKWFAELGHLGQQVAERSIEVDRLRAAVERAEVERKTRSRDQIAAMASLRSQVWRLAAALERRAKESGERVEYWRVYGDVMKDLGGIGDEGGDAEPE